MNANQMINMVIRIVMRQLVSRGVRAGMDAAGNQISKRSRSKTQQPSHGQEQQPGRRSDL